MVQLANSAPIALKFLFKRLKWPVPMVRWRAAKEIRNLLNTDVTRQAATEQLLASLEGCLCESEVCALLSIIFMTSVVARPPQAAVIEKIKHPSLLSDMLLERTYGKGMGGWIHPYAGEAPWDFESGTYFETHCTAHVPPILKSNLRRLERTSGAPLLQQWAFEWKTLCDHLGTRLTQYPHYFGDTMETRSGIMGQFWQCMREVYVSAYLRTLAHAVSEWGLPQRIAEGYCLDIVDGVAGMFEIEPGARPTWLSDIPERFCAPDADFGAIARELVEASQKDGMVAVSIDTPISASVQRFARLQITTHLITADYEIPEGEYLYEKMQLFVIERTFDLRGAPPSITLDEVSSVGSKGGDEAAVCSCLFPIPFGGWQGHIFGLGLAIPAPYVITNTEISCTAEGINMMSRDQEILSTTRVWNDGWVPTHPKSSSTRCGFVTMLDVSCLEQATIRLDRQLALFVRLRTWDREEEYGEYEEMERNQLIVL
ncbi:hypothetical protein [Pseudomonas sp. 18058]|uniref:hypothetical protein n=1 Tax=Pseudomonas sp. 18058 TaxID=2681406 RepID=UPI00135737DE|nr:hypothetical protein [Pseudomonas sp. 18058]